MRERAILECIQDIADSWYHKTGDKWYLALGLETAKKLRRKHYCIANIDLERDEKK